MYCTMLFISLMGQCINKKELPSHSNELKTVSEVQGSSLACRRAERGIVLEVCQQATFEPVTGHHCVIRVIPGHSGLLARLPILRNEGLLEALIVSSPAVKTCKISFCLLHVYINTVSQTSGSFDFDILDNNIVTKGAKPGALT